MNTYDDATITKMNAYAVNMVFKVMLATGTLMTKEGIQSLINDFYKVNNVDEKERLKSFTEHMVLVPATEDKIIASRYFPKRKSTSEAEVVEVKKEKKPKVETPKVKAKIVKAPSPKKVIPVVVVETKTNVDSSDSEDSADEHCAPEESEEE